MKELKQAYAPQGANTTRVIVHGRTKKDRFVIEFKNKYRKDIFKDDGIKFPF